MLLAMGTVLLGRENDLLLALLLTAAVCLGACGTFAVSFLLSKLLHREAAVRPSCSSCRPTGVRSPKRS